VNGFNDVIKQLETQKAAIERALEALQEVEGEVSGGSAAPARVTAKKRGRPAKRKGGMTPEGKARLVAALKKRHADRKAAQEIPVAKTASLKPTRKGVISEAGRKALADAMKRRWAAKRTAAQAKKRGRPKKAA
jgi:hypothetical protein